MNDVEILFHRTIATLSQADPLIKLLEQVRLGRMQRADPGLRVVTDAWLAAYRKAIASSSLTRELLRRIDPSPRLDVLIQEGILSADHAGARELRSEFEQAIARAPG